MNLTPCCLRLLATKVAPSTSLMSALLSEPDHRREEAPLEAGTLEGARQLPRIPEMRLMLRARDPPPLRRCRLRDHAARRARCRSTGRLARGRRSSCDERLRQGAYR